MSESELRAVATELLRLKNRHAIRNEAWEEPACGAAWDRLRALLARPVDEPIGFASTCPECGATDNDATETFCVHCGERLPIVPSADSPTTPLTIQDVQARAAGGIDTANVDDALGRPIERGRWYGKDADRLNASSPTNERVGRLRDLLREVLGGLTVDLQHRIVEELGRLAHEELGRSSQTSNNRKGE